MAFTGLAQAETLRIATYNAGLQRKGPGLLLADIEKGEDEQITAAARVIAHVSPDIILITSLDYDYELKALSAFATLLADNGANYPHLFALRPNTGFATGLDLDGDGRLGEPADAQGFGYFAGQGGMAILSRFPIAEAEVRDFSGFLWQDLPGALLPEKDGAPFPSAAAQAAQRLSTTGHWAVPVILPNAGRLTLLAWYATPPVFDGPEDRNGKRNHDETVFWSKLLENALDVPPPEPPFVLLGDANLDPFDGDGLSEAMVALLAHPLLTDPEPSSEGGQIEAELQGGTNARHRGPPALDTADWRDDGGPGNLRVDYVLPSSDLTVSASGVFWPPPDDPMAELVKMASSHRLVWVDITLP